ICGQSHAYPEHELFSGAATRSRGRPPHQSTTLGLVRARARANFNSLRWKKPRASPPTARAERAEELGEPLDAAAQVLDRDPLVHAVHRLLVVVGEDERHEAVARDAPLAEVVAVGEARDHARD